MIGKFLESQIYEKNTIFALSESITMMENPKNRKWKVLTSEYLARKPWFTVRHESLELPDGRRIPDYYVFEYPDWINVTAAPATDGSC